MTVKINIDGWLAFNRNGTAKWSVREPNLDRNWRAMQVRLTVPASLFSTPTIKATIIMPDDDRPPAYEINADTAAEALKSVLGVDIDLRIIPPEDTP